MLTGGEERRDSQPRARWFGLIRRPGRSGRWGRTYLEDVEADVSSRECDVWVEARCDELDGGCGVRVVGGEVEGDPECEPRVRLQARQTMKTSELMIRKENAASS